MFDLTFTIWAFIAAITTLCLGLLCSRQSQIIWLILMFVVFYLIAWVILPPIGINMLSTWIFLWSILAVASCITAFAYENRTGFKLWRIPVGFGALIVGAMISSSGVFNAQEMANVIHVKNHGQKEVTISLVSQEQARRVTPNIAMKRAAELIGSAKQPGLASVAKFGDVYGNVTGGTAVWVAPLVPTGFWRWVSNPTTPGYVVVSHINVNDSRLVEDRSISYGTSGFYFGKNLYRHLYMNGYVNYKYGDAFFQIDDEGVPYYVVPLERPQVGFWAYYPERWVIVNASTGEITPIESKDELPQWVDRAYPVSLMNDRLKDWGCFSTGAWACYVSGVNVIVPTPGMVVTMDDDREMIYYTGTQFQNNKSEGATSGVAIVDARTGEVGYYRRSGITEMAAVEIINGAVSNYDGWDAEDPVLIKVNGLETYFAIITDQSGAQKSYGMVWQRNRNVYGTGKSLEATVRAYLRSVKNNKNMIALEGDADIDPVVFTGLVVSINPVVTNGETAFYLRIDTVADKIFVVNTESPAEVATTNVDEPVRLTAINTEPGVIEVDTFNNLSVAITESEQQVQLNVESWKTDEKYTDAESCYY